MTDEGKCPHGARWSTCLEEHPGHEHRWGGRIDGLAGCYVEGCTATNYDDQWGAGIFTDWPRGTSKPYGA